MKGYLEAACVRLGVAVEQVMSYAENPERGNVGLVVNYGIEGGKEYAFPMSELAVVIKAKSYAATVDARRLARARDIDLEQIEGTGKFGRITVADIRRAMKEEG